MWEINANEVIKTRTDTTSPPFSLFVDTVIRTHSYLCGIPDSDIATNLRETIPDGGVDTEVKSGFSSDETGWMKVPTCWQHKTSPCTNISKADLIKEVNKPYAADLIKKGYGYRFCICDDFPAEKKNDYFDILKSEIARINVKAPSPMVLNASDIAAWAGRYPAIILKVRPALAGTLNLEKWKTEITRMSNVYVDIDEWKFVVERISEHIDLHKPGRNIVLPVQGQAGIGKTRLVYETIAPIEGIRAMVVYTKDEEKALAIAHDVIMNTSHRAILVADECSKDTRLKLETSLASYTDRIRVVAIDNIGDYPLDQSARIWLPKFEIESTENILEKNFPDIPRDRRKHYAEQSGRFVRLALDLCSYDDMIVSTGGLKPGLDGIRDYVNNRVREEEKKRALYAISLFKRIGFKGDVANQLKTVCEILSLNEREIKEAATNLKEAPGFVTLAGRYYYISPEIVANILFEDAWRLWIEDDPDKFLSKLPDDLIDSLGKRVKNCHSDDIKKVVSDFFREWFARLTPETLRDLPTVKRMVTLVETDPDVYLPMMKELVESSSIENLLKVSGVGYNGQWGPRRSLVWLAQNIAAFSEYFEYAEPILLRLAIAEEETGIGNNATAIWKQLFRIGLSGTSIPFEKRLAILKTRIFSDEPECRELAIDALHRIFDRHMFRMGTPAVISGRFAPEEWMPTKKNIHTYLVMGIDLLLEIAQHEDKRYRNGLFEILTGSMAFFLGMRELDRIKTLASLLEISDESMPRLIQKIEEFLWLEGVRKDGKRVDSDYEAKIREWLNELSPTNFHARLLKLINTDPWHYSRYDDETAWQKEIAEIGKKIYERGDLLKEELGTIIFGKYQTVLELGFEIGKLDEGAVFLHEMFNIVKESESATFTKGYVNALMKFHSQHAELVNKEIDEIEAKYPMPSFEISHAGGDLTNAIERAFKLVDTGAIEPERLGYFSYGISGRKISIDELNQIIKRLLPEVEKESQDAIRVGLVMISHWFRIEDGADELIGQNKESLVMLWDFIEQVAHKGTHNWYSWRKILQASAKMDIDRATKIASIALTTEGIHEQSESIKVLSQLAMSAPDIVMQRVGEIMMDEKTEYHFYVNTYKDLFSSIPTETIKSWLDEHGVEGARRIARHLPEPRLSQDGEPIVPDLTEYVLTKFGDDERTFTEFSAGVHSFQWYSGDIAAEHEAEADIARKFLNHPVKAIHKWATQEIRSQELHAKQWRERRAEEESDKG